MEWRDFLNAFKGNSVLLLVRSRTQPSKATEVSDDEPLPVRVVGGSSGGGGGSDPDSAREATLQTVSTHTQAVNDNTSILASQAQGNGLHVLPPVSIEDYPPQQLNVGVETGLDVPFGATHALVSVAQGQVRIGLHDTANGLLLGAGDTYTLTGTQLASFRLVYGGGGVDALVRVDYWREAHAAVTV